MDDTEQQTVKSSDSLEDSATRIKSMRRKITDSLPDKDSQQFFHGNQNFSAASKYAKDIARRSHSAQSIQMWIKLMDPAQTFWPVLTIAVAAAYIFANGFHPHISYLAETAISAVCVAVGARMARSAAFNSRTPQTAAQTSHIAIKTSARAGAIIAGIGVLFGIVTIGKHIGVFGVTAAAFACAAAAFYALLPIFIDSLPGEELLPAILTGPFLFFITFRSQQFYTSQTIPAHGKVPASVQYFPVQWDIHTLWLLALALGCLYFIVSAARRMSLSSANTLQATGALIGLRGMRALFAAGIVAFYALILLLVAQHGSIIRGALLTLFSLPYAALPLSGVFLAKNETALGAVYFESRRLVWIAGLTLCAGLLLSGLYFVISHHFSVYVK